MKVTSFDQLTKKIVSQSFINPSTGEVFEVDLKELGPNEVTFVLYSEREPVPPINKENPFSKDEYTGKVMPNYDEKDPTYRKAMAQYNDRFLYRWIEASLTFSIPGDTLEDRIKALEGSIPNWVLIQFRARLEEVNGIRDSDLVRAKKKLLRQAEEQSLKLPDTGA